MQHHVAVEDREQRVEITIARGRQECVDEPTLMDQIRCGVRRFAANAATGTRRELCGAVLGAAHDRRDLGVRLVEHVV
jgi:hypothetical protein